MKLLPVEEELLRKTYLQVLGRIELATEAAKHMEVAIEQQYRNLEADREWARELQNRLLEVQKGGQIG